MASQSVNEFQEKKKSPPRKMSKAEIALKLAEGYRFLYKIFSEKDQPIGLGIYGDYINDPIILSNSEVDIDYRFDTLLEADKYLKGCDPDHMEELRELAIKKRKNYVSN